MKKVPLKKIVVLVTLGLILFMSKGMAQVDKGVTSTGKEVDCSTIDPSVDKTVSEHGKIVTHPRVTRNGKLITDDCGCPVSIDCTNCTDTVNCISITMSAPILSGDVTSAVLQIFSDAGYTTQVGSNITAAVSGGKITATAANLSCYTKYYLRLTLNNNSNCTFDWADSTRDVTVEKPTTCDVLLKFANEHSSAAGTIDSVYDHEGNAYAVVQIGEQCWLKENMRAVTSPTTGTYFIKPSPQVETYSGKTGRWSLFDSTMAVSRHYGVLYNWNATMDIYNASKGELDVSNSLGDAVSLTVSTSHRGICPQGWHVPTEGEYLTMETTALELQESHPTPDPTLETQNQFRAANTALASIIAGGCYWCSSTKANAPGSFNNSLRNASGFSAYPAEADKLTECGGAHFWTATQYGTSQAGCANIYHNVEGVNWYIRDPKTYCLSVRCVRDVIIPEFSLCEDTTFGTVTLKEIQNVEKIEFVQGSTVVKTISNPASEIFVNDLAEGNYKVKVTSSTGDTLVDNARIKHTYTHCTVGQVRVNEMGNNTRLDSVRDHQNNWYEVVQIGNQCWLKQNMRATTKPDGTNILQYPTTGQSTTVPYAYYYNDNSANVRSYGLLYNWAAAMNGAASSAANPSGVRGICPEGWHLPSNAEYTTLMNEVGVTQQSSASGTTGNSGRLVTGCNWNTYDNATSPGNYSYTERNLSGFSAVPSGNYNGGTTFQFEGERTFLWTATASNTELAYYRVIAYDFPVTTYTTNTKYSGRSVRCVRDMEIVPTLSICEDNFFGEIKLTEVENAVRVEVLNSGNAVVNTINNPVSGAVLTGLASDTYTVRAISTSGNFAAETADLVKEYTHCTVTSLRENERGATTTQLDSVCDHQNNWYEVVEIDGKCWLRENMRCTTSPNGRLNVAPSKYWGPNNYYTAPGTAPVYKYGYLYNWSGALDVQETNPASISSLPQNTRGICPEGWHIPVIDEWTALRNALVGESTSQTAYSGNTAYAVNTQISTILADGCDWLSDASANNKPGDYGNSNRNSSKFNWRPSPNYYGSNGTASCNTEGRSGYLWSASPNPDNSSYAYMVYLHYTQTGIISGPDNKSHGRNVRCVRNN